MCKQQFPNRTLIRKYCFLGSNASFRETIPVCKTFTYSHVNSRFRIGMPNSLAKAKVNEEIKTVDETGTGTGERYTQV